MVGAISAATSIGVDLEGDGLHRYPPKVCLVQISLPDAIFLIDPLTGVDMEPFGRILADRRIEKIFHSADHDLRTLDRDWGIRVDGLFDTAIAAAFLGQPRMGLGTVLMETLGVDIPKSRRLQKSDWSLRPLSGDALKYAASDVEHLIRLREEMGSRLAELGRTDWVREECERLSSVRYVPPDPESGFLSVKGSYALDGGGLAVLKELAEFREREALRRGRPPFWVLSNEAMVTLAADPKTDPSSIKGMRKIADGPAGRKLRDAIRRGVKAPPFERPRPARRFRPKGAPKVDEKTYRRRLDALREWRNGHAESLSLAPGLIWPMASMERLARDPDQVTQEMEACEVRRWQVAEFGESLTARTGGLDEAD